MERRDSEVTASFVMADAVFVPGASITLNDDVSRHLKVRRIGLGAQLALLDGHGHRAEGSLVRVAPNATIEIARVSVAAPLPAVHLLVPMADRDRSMWLAEKATELGITSWRPIMYKRSKSVKPRGEGPTFTARLRARMASALEQSGGLWLPQIFPESTLVRALAAVPSDGARALLTIGAPTPMTSVRCAAPLVIALGPEGGLEADETALFVESGFTPVHVGGNVLRFETAALAGLAIGRTLLSPRNDE